MIKITKTVIEVDASEFYNEVKRVCEELVKFTPNQFAANYAIMKKELGLKMTELQFLNLCEDCGIRVWRKAIWFDQFKTDKK